VGRRSGAAGIARWRGLGEGQREEEERKGGREADRWGPGVSASVKKKTGRGRGGPAREAGWATWAEREPVLFSFFSFLFFKLHFQTKFISN
jgi:hypothetical protein